jgi:hypothetical protein
MIIRIPLTQRALVVETSAGALRREMAAGYADTAATRRDLERCLEADDRSARAFWDQMAADGVAVAKPAEPDLELEAGG